MDEDIEPEGDVFDDHDDENDQHKNSLIELDPDAGLGAELGDLGGDDFGQINDINNINDLPVAEMAAQPTNSFLNDQMMFNQLEGAPINEIKIEETDELAELENVEVVQEHNEDPKPEMVDQETQTQQTTLVEIEVQTERI